MWENWDLAKFNLAGSVKTEKYGTPRKKHEVDCMSKKEIKVPVEVYSRVVGYFRPVNQWNRGKQEEFLNRKEYKVNILDNSPVYECQGNL